MPHNYEKHFLENQFFFTNVDEINNGILFLRSNKLEQLDIKLEKNIGIQKHAGKVRKGKLPLESGSVALSMS